MPSFTRLQFKLLARIPVRHLRPFNSSFRAHSSVDAAASALATDQKSPSKPTKRLPTDNLKLSDFTSTSINAPGGMVSTEPSEISSNHMNSLDSFLSLTPSLKFHIETYGCQMNISDSEIVRSILLSNGHEHTDDIAAADLILANTCAIRENAENKVWQRLSYFHSIRKKNRKAKKNAFYPIVGVLGCMAERLKEKLLEEESVDFVCGPDAYRDIPRLLQSVLHSDQKEANTQLSLEETYADINPVRESANSVHAFVSIMRGCNNMCSFCIVPFTRGRERSRELTSILREVHVLTQEKGVKEVVLLGQNVNGFHDTAPASQRDFPATTYKVSTAGFTNLYNSRKRYLPGARFVDLLEGISDVDSEIRIRFTSPHPKDFPLEVLQLIAERPNICKSIHLPLQSGSSDVLQRMRRGYSNESYLELVQSMRATIPTVAISTDIITGFCGETEAEHAETLRVMEAVAFDQAFMYAYSLRERTYAAYHLADDVTSEVKSRRLQEIIAIFRKQVIAKNIGEESGQYRLVLVEGPSTRSTDSQPMLTGRTDGNKRVVFPAARLVAFTPEQQLQVLSNSDSTDLFHRICTQEVDTLFSALDKSQLLSRGLTDELLATAGAGATAFPTVNANDLVGQFVLVRVLEAASTNLKGVGLFPSGVMAFDQLTRALATSRNGL